MHISENCFSCALSTSIADAIGGATGTGCGLTSDAFVPDEESVMQLINFGFTRPQCVKALKCTNGNMERAADWLFNHPDDMGKAVTSCNCD